MPELGNLIWENSSEKENPGFPRPVSGRPRNWVGQLRHAHCGSPAPAAAPVVAMATRWPSSNGWGQIWGRVWEELRARVT